MTIRNAFSVNRTATMRVPYHAQSKRQARSRRYAGSIAGLLMLLLLIVCSSARAQVVAAAKGGNFGIRVGGFGSYYNSGFANNTGTGSSFLGGVGIFTDIDLRPKLSLEGEARFLRFNQNLNVHEDSYLAGIRYSFSPYAKYRPYAKLLGGVGEFNFPYNLAHGGYGAIAFGGGIDREHSRKLRWRIIDVEYQRWPGFQNSTGLSPWGISTGLAVKVF